MGAEGGLQTLVWGNSGCCGCVDSLLSGCFGQVGGQLRAASCQQSCGDFCRRLYLGPCLLTSDYISGWSSFVKDFLC